VVPIVPLFRECGCNRLGYNWASAATDSVASGLILTDYGPRSHVSVWKTSNGPRLNRDNRQVPLRCYGGL
jgi:hypothetical protein